MNWKLIKIHVVGITKLLFAYTVFCLTILLSIVGFVKFIQFLNSI